MPRMVNCVKLGKELPGLARPPFPGELGKRIYNSVSQPGWQLWQEQSTLIINHYGLNLADPRATETLMKEMEEFFFGEGARVPDDWTPEGEGGDKAAPTKGAPAKGAPSRK
ncbi:MAG: oxidative damage protection protein [Chloroflexi bacterium]|nr:oxidative damage protection protein [Chloroflexota bacterium]